MPPQIDERLVRLSIEINGQLKQFTELYIMATGTLYANGIQNEIDIKIANLTKADQDWLVTALSPYVDKRTQKIVMLEAGRKSTGYKLVFSGSAIRAEMSSPPDIYITLKARTGAFQNGDIVSVTGGPTSQLSELSGKVAASLGLNLNFQATDKTITNFAFQGGATKQIDALAQAGNIRAFEVNGQLVIQDIVAGDEITGPVVILNRQTGLIDIPKLDIQGVEAKFLLDAWPTLGGGMTIEEPLYPACNGTYRIYKLDFAISNRDNPFYWIARGSRPGLGGVK